MRKTVYLTMVLLSVALLVVLLAVTCAPAFAEAVPGANAAPNIDLTAIINAAIALIGAIITYKLIPYLKEKLTDAQYQRMMSVVNVAVYAAEEIYQAGHGADKLNYVQTYLRSKGYNVDIEEIKAAVKRMRDAEKGGVVIENISDASEGFEVDGDWPDGDESAE